MDYHIISVLKSVTFILMLVLPSYLIVPKGLRAWELWKKTTKPIYLSHFLLCMSTAFLSYAAALVVTIMRILGLA